MLKRYLAALSILLVVCICIDADRRKREVVVVVVDVVERYNRRVESEEREKKEFEGRQNGDGVFCG